MNILTEDCREIRAEDCREAREDAASQDAELVLMAMRGDRTAFDQLIERNYQRCVGIAVLILREKTEAQDQVQKAFFKAFKHLDQFEGRADFRSWLARIVENECLMLIRAQRRAKLVYIDDRRSGDNRSSFELPERGRDEEQDLVMRQLATVARHEIRRMPPLLRDVIWLRDVDELSMSEVAARLGVTIAVAKSRLTRARQEARNRVLARCGKSDFRLPPAAFRYSPAKSASSRN